MRLPRMTVRRWMIAVAVLAMALVVWRLIRFSNHCAELTAKYAALENHWTAVVFDLRVYAQNIRELVKGGELDKAREIAADSELHTAEHWAEYYREVAKIRHRAARHPWLPLPPDPLIPK